MEVCEVLVVGAGPAGSTAAWALARQGVDVLVVDKQCFPRDKVCAGWITPAVVHALQLDLDDYCRGRVLQPICAFRSGLLGGPALETHYPATISYGIRRCEFDDYLLRRSAARLRLGEAVRSIIRDGDGWIVNGEISARTLIGAGGHYCPVARHLGNRLGREEDPVSAQEVEFRLTPEQAAQWDFDGQCPELYFLPDLSGYAWVFRKGDYLNVGLGSHNSHRLGERVHDFADWLYDQHRMPAPIFGRFKGHAYLLYGNARRPLAVEGALLVGDAAGLACDQSGEGIRPAVESALLAAAALIARRGGDTADVAQRYRRCMVERFGARRGAGLNAGAFEGIKRFAAPWIMRNPWFTRHVLFDRWFLQRHIRAGIR
jgi:geranylgeranyl reductase family protein